MKQRCSPKLAGRLSACAPLRAMLLAALLWLAGCRPATAIFAGSPTPTLPAVTTASTTLRPGQVELLQQLGLGVAKKVAFSADGRVMAALTGAGLRIHRLPGLEVIRLIPMPPGVLQIALSTDGGMAAASDSSGAISTWDIRSGALLQSVKIKLVTARNLAFSSKGMLAANGFGAVYVWDPRKGQEPQELPAYPNQGLASFAFSPDGSALAALDCDRGVFRWKLADLTPLGSVPLSDINAPELQKIGVSLGAVAYSPDGKLLAAACRADRIALLDASGGPEQAFDAGPGGVVDLAFSPDGAQLLSLSRSPSTYRDQSDGQTAVLAPQDNRVSAWDIRSGARRQISLEREEVQAGLGFLPSGELIFLTHQSLYAWNPTVDGPAALRRLPYTAPISSLALSPDGSDLAAGYSDGLIRLWDLQRGAVFQTWEAHTGAVTALRFTPDGRWLVSSSKDHSIRVWDAATGALLHALSDAPSVVIDLDISPDGKLAAGAYADGVTRLFDLASGRLVARLEGPAGSKSSATYSVAFSPDGAWLASGSGGDSRVDIWEVSSQKRLRTMNVPYAQNSALRAILDLAWYPNSRLLLTAGDDSDLREWDAASGQLVRVYADTGGANRAAFSPDGSLLAAASMYVNARGLFLWCVDRPEPPQTIKGPRDLISTLLFTPDGSRLIAGDEGGIIWIWGNRAPAP